MTADGLTAPVVVLDITGGCEQWRLTAPGTGEPVVLVLDFDDEADIEWKRENLDRATQALELLELAGADTGYLARTVADERHSFDDFAAEIDADPYAVPA